MGMIKTGTSLFALCMKIKKSFFGIDIVRAVAIRGVYGV
jgi:hypothetical protein